MNLFTIICIIIGVIAYIAIGVLLGAYALLKAITVAEKPENYLLGGSHTAGAALGVLVITLAWPIILVVRQFKG